MSQILTSLELKDFLTTLASGELNLATECAWVVIAIALSMIGGAIGGMLLAGKDIGYQFAAMLGSLFAPAGVIPAVIFGLTVLNLLTNF
ncbi:hypothetical protein Cylst_5466 [Cylindrospermum stagnale PCC 7417]|uniref:ABC transporter permease n=1 Tax=Cylindrospermum stagnale PCC 7417 TaxID=56107 RepID=K9X4S0_9NOST|nr:hypothetical protein [Cylindrospermum stagnale]AFZ27478.1 hypothetical protein Cylst_5466 [Cylindrospermum stagnale PCC 7417]